MKGKIKFNLSALNLCHRPDRNWKWDILLVQDKQGNCLCTKHRIHCNAHLCVILIESSCSSDIFYTYSSLLQNHSLFF